MKKFDDYRAYVIHGGLAVRAFDLRLNGHEFESHRLLALPDSDLGQVTHIILAAAV